jgi:hypothetical protein
MRLVMFYAGQMWTRRLRGGGRFTILQGCALVDVISAGVSKEQTCNRWLCSAAISGIRTLPRLSSPSEVIAPAGEHGRLVAWSVESS